MEDLETIKQLYRDGSYIDHRSSPHLSGRLLVIVWNHGPESIIVIYASLVVCDDGHAFRLYYGEFLLYSSQMS